MPRAEIIWATRVAFPSPSSRIMRVCSQSDGLVHVPPAAGRERVRVVKGGHISKDIYKYQPGFYCTSTLKGFGKINRIEYDCFLKVRNKSFCKEG